MLKTVFRGFALFVTAVYPVVILIWVPERALCQTRGPDIAFARELVDGVLGRTDAVFSGQMDYHLKRGIANSGTVINEGDYRFAFSGELDSPLLPWEHRMQP
jgi:hypothetical protein